MDEHLAKMDSPFCRMCWIDTITGLIEEIEQAGKDGLSRRRENSAHAIRNLLETVPVVRDLAESAVVCSFVEPILGPGAFAVRGLLFDKTPEANWKVAWHQDLTIAVRQRKEVPGFGPWSVKAGVPHVQAPIPYWNACSLSGCIWTTAVKITVPSSPARLPPCGEDWRRKYSSLARPNFRSHLRG